VSITEHPDITSPKNRWIKLARSLHRRRQRYREGAILVEGVRPIREAILVDADFQAILVATDVGTDSEAYETAELALTAQLPVFTVSPNVFSLATDTESPQGILAICVMPQSSFDISTRESPLVLIVDQVRDPGNMGTLIRSAMGAGVDVVLVAKSSVDPYSPKVIRAGAGSHFHLPIGVLDWDSPPQLLERCTIYAAVADEDSNYDEIDWTKASAIVIGNETSGVSSAGFQRVHGTVGIPLANSLESLNAGVAGSVILFEARRQRRNA
jgi:RNA methyltransferase, TrmH family